MMPNSWQKLRKLICPVPVMSTNWRWGSGGVSEWSHRNPQSKPTRLSKLYHGNKKASYHGNKMLPKGRKELVMDEYIQYDIRRPYKGTTKVTWNPSKTEQRFSTPTLHSSKLVVLNQLCNTPTLRSTTTLVYNTKTLYGNLDLFKVAVLSAILGWYKNRWPTYSCGRI